MLYDADRIESAASVPDDADLYCAQLSIFLDPNDPAIIAQARADGVPEAWLEAARRSPVYRMAIDWKIAFPLHPEYRTLPMVWYVPPLSPIQAKAEAGQLGTNGVIPDVGKLRIPLRYLANLLTAGDERPIRIALERLLAMRAFMRARHVDGVEATAVLDQVGLDLASVEDMYKTLAIANYEDRFVIPTTHREYAENTFDLRSSCGFSFGNGCSSGGNELGLFGRPKHRHGVKKETETAS
jgi:nitrate reductase beta subunit